ncbi:hypothetical protein CORC01_09168 [Colletotrichum orchidophilum]|uniref:Uncharacterized protein n=1 Tax=Colletotrichum orchidophilum TaxID=1209926 RepID=A0A1G4B2C9_9PEZI|nr:uncharacterized protein CORC01_09168 [Colletotrichum orchidophilum]OHE95578.1 hypothetical protein CORC01_09168 [Colletotrichum orchidophilum]
MLLMRTRERLVDGLGDWFICFLDASLEDCFFGIRYVGFRSDGVCRLCDLSMSSSRGGKFMNRQGELVRWFGVRDQGPRKE